MNIDYLRQDFNEKCRLFNVAGYRQCIFKVWLTWLSFICAISFYFQTCQIIQWLPRSHLVTCPMVKIKSSWNIHSSRASEHGSAKLNSKCAPRKTMAKGKANYFIILPRMYKYDLAKISYIWKLLSIDLYYIIQ